LTEESKRRAKKLAEESRSKGDATSWFETLYHLAAGDASNIPWADLAPHPGLAGWLASDAATGNGRKTLVVGCGLGDDAEALAAHGFNVTAFDIAPTAIEWAKRRFPGSSVDYQIADLFNAPPEWHRAFDFVAEVYTFQSLPGDIRPAAMAAAAQLVAPGGSMLVVCRAREPEEPVVGPPWHLAVTDLIVLTDAGLVQKRFYDYLDDQSPPTRRFRIEYRRPAA